MLWFLFWNVWGIILLILLVCLLLEKLKCDIVILLEYKFSKNFVNYFNSIYFDYYSILKIDSDLEDSFVLWYCGKGGVVIFINKNL